MKLKFKHQRFQEDAAKAVCDVFTGQPYRESSYMIDPGQLNKSEQKLDLEDYLGFKNNPIITALTDDRILRNIQDIQRESQIKPSDKLEGHYNLTIDEEVTEYKDSIISLLDSIYDPQKLIPEDLRKNNITLQLNKDQFNRTEFQKLWKLISPKSYYIVRFDNEELKHKAIDCLNVKLRVSRIYMKVTSGSMNKIESKGALKAGTAFKTEEEDTKTVNVSANNSVKYDLIGKITENTGLTRKSVVDILQGIGKNYHRLVIRNWQKEEDCFFAPVR